MFLVDDLANYWINRDALERAQEKTEARERELRDINISKGEYKPNLYDTPEDIKFREISLDPSLRQNQVSALEKMQTLANSRAGAQSDFERQQAMMEANRNAQNQQQAIINNAASRGQGGSMMEYMLRQQAAQDASNRAGMMGLKAASDAALERLQANGLYNQGLSNLRQQDTQLGSANADIFNKFNTLNAERARDVSMRNKDMLNQGQQINYARDANRFNQEMQKWQAMGGPHGEEMTNIGMQGKNNQQLVHNWANFMKNMASWGGGGGMAGGFGGGGGSGAAAGAAGGAGGGASGGMAFMSNPYVKMAMQSKPSGGEKDDDGFDNSWNWYS